MSVKSIIIATVAGGVVLSLSVGLISLRNSVDGRAAVVIDETGPVIVAMADIPIGERLTDENVTLEEWPLDDIPEDAATSIAHVDGRQPKQPLFSGDVIVLAKLTDPSSSCSECQIPRGFRVASIKVVHEESQEIIPGDHVDVLTNPTADHDEEMAGQLTIITDVTVFAVDNNVTLFRSVKARTVSLLLKKNHHVNRLKLAEEITGPLILHNRTTPVSVIGDSSP